MASDTVMFFAMLPCPHCACHSLQAIPCNDLECFSNLLQQGRASQVDALWDSEATYSCGQLGTWA